jgi:uncharacterized protein YjbI with pentapeptide repeats
MSDSDFVRQAIDHAELLEMANAYHKYNISEGKEGHDIDLAGYLIEDFDFSGLDLTGLNGRISTFVRCKFNGCDLYYSYFNDSEFTDVDFSDAILVKAELCGIQANNTCFDRAKLVRAEFMECKFTDVSFRNADLNSSIISNSDLIRTCFDGADIEGSAIHDNNEEDTSWGNLRE